MSSGDRPDIAVILSLVGGILILLSGAVTSLWFVYGGPFFGMMGGMMGGSGGMMGGYAGMMGSIGIPFGFMASLSLVGLVSGILVIVGAVMLNSRSGEHEAWGIVILTFSLVSFLSIGGFLVGAMLGTVGGAFALSWRPTAKA